MFEQCSQIVRDRSASDDQHALFAQRAQRTTQRNMPSRIPVRLQRKLCSRDICFGIHKTQRHPGTVIKATRFIKMHWYSRLAQCNRCRLRHFRCTRRGILQFI